jgi:hypothetical protein
MLVSTKNVAVSSIIVSLRVEILETRNMLEEFVVLPWTN